MEESFHAYKYCKKDVTRQKSRNTRQKRKNDIEYNDINTMVNFIYRGGYKMSKMSFLMHIMKIQLS